jgi:hypothetical protein
MTTAEFLRALYPITYPRRVKQTVEAWTNLLLWWRK